MDIRSKHDQATAAAKAGLSTAAPSAAPVVDIVMPRASTYDEAALHQSAGASQWRDQAPH